MTTPARKDTPVNDGAGAFANIARYCLPSSFLLLSGLLLFPSAGRDDSHITYWSAYSLSHFGEILNYNGDRVEQSSSLLHVLLLAAVHSISRIDLVVAGRVLSVLCAIATLVAVHGLGARIRTGAGFATALLSSSCVFFVYWSFGGLESSLASLIAVAAILAWASYLLAPGSLALATATLATSLLALVRPEMPVVILCALLGSASFLALRRWKATNAPPSQERWMLGRLGVLAGLSAAVCLLIFGFRMAYFDSLFPQPVIAKSAGLSWQRTGYGLQYLFFGSHPESSDAATTGFLVKSFIAIPFAIGVVGALRAAWDEFTRAHVNPHAMLSLTFLLAYLSFIVLTEGDWMEGGRMISHALPIAMAFVAYALVTYVGPRWVRRAILIGLFSSQVFVLLNFAASRSAGMPLWTSLEQVEHYAHEYGASEYSYFDRTNRDHLRNITTIYWLDQIVDQLIDDDHEKIHIMAHQMGVMPFYLTQKYFRRVQFFDVNGLTDRVTTDAAVFSSAPRSTIGTKGVGSYFMQHRFTVEDDPDVVSPDLIVFQFYQDHVPRAVFEKCGYEVVYVQSGEVSTGSRHFPGRRMWAYQLIAVRRDLLRELTKFPPPRLDIRETGIVQPGSAW